MNFLKNVGAAAAGMVKATATGFNYDVDEPGRALEHSMWTLHSGKSRVSPSQPLWAIAILLYDISSGTEPLPGDWESCVDLRMQLQDGVGGEGCGSAEWHATAERERAAAPR
jgi:hypothetical protein